MTTKWTKKLLTIVMAFAMMMAMAVPAWAANNDPNLTDYNTYYTNITKVGEGGMYELKVVPAAANYLASVFTSEQAAKNVQWTTVDGSVADVILDAEATALPITGGYASQMIVAAMGEIPGCASIMAVNPAASSDNAYMNFTVVVDAETAPATNVKYQVYTSNTATPVTGTLPTVSGSEYVGDTHFASALDAVLALGRSGQGVVVSAANITKYASTNPMANTYELTKMTVNGQEYAAAGMTGWQYRVYDAAGKVIPTSEYVGLDDFALLNAETGEPLDGCTIVLKYGAWGTVTFPETLK